MKGIIFNYLEEFVEIELGEFYWVENISSLKLDTENAMFISPGSYTDKDLISILSYLIEKENLNLEEVLFNFGIFVCRKFSKEYSIFFEKCSSAKSFLMSVHDVIHVEVKKIYKNAQTPEFYYDDQSENGLLMKYVSKRELIPFVKGMIQQVGDYYLENIQIKSIEKLKNTELPTYVFELEFSRVMKEAEL